MPSDYLAREQVDVGGQAGPSFPRGDVGDVAAPHAVPLLDGEFPIQDIGPFVRGPSAPADAERPACLLELQYLVILVRDGVAISRERVLAVCLIFRRPPSEGAARHVELIGQPPP